MSSRSEETALRLRREKLIAIVRGNFPTKKLLEIGDALLAAPLLVMEVTLNSGGALDAIALLRRRFEGNLLVGAGTVRTAAQLDTAVQAGAQFTVAPNLDLATVERARTHDVLHLPGVFTPSEAQAAFIAGCSMVKLFPSDIVGPRYLKALRAPLDDIDFVPTGGITPENVGDYVRAGAAAAGLGSALITGPDQSMADLINRARALRSGWEAAEGAGHSSKPAQEGTTA